MPRDRLDPLPSVVVPALAERLVLWLNHVIAGEAQAVDRLRPHVGRAVRITVEGAPSWLPAAPPLALRVTPAALLERVEGLPPDAADLQVGFDLSDPAGIVDGLLDGRRPAVTIRGDAAFATDVNWLLDHVRWDLPGDVERLLGPPAGAVAARAVEKAGDLLATGLREGLRTLANLRAR